jgi:hypothetical protein
LRIESHPIVEGRLVRVATAGVFRPNGDDECPKPPNRRLPRVGSWYSNSPNAEWFDYWRIQDGAWFADVRRNDVLGYATVERIVLTVRAKGFVEKCAEEARWVRHTAADISVIAPSHEPELAPGIEAGDHWISTTERRPNSMIGHHGLIVMVKVTPSDVELVRCSSWVA